MALQRAPRSGGSSLLRRDGEGAQKKPPSNEDKMKQAAEKVGDALLKTDLGKEIKKKAGELGEDFVSTLGGKVATGGAIAGALAYLIGANKELPMQIPELPLDKLAPGLKATIVWEGPVRDPTKGMITFTYRPGAPSSPKKGAPTEKEKFRAETARMAAEQQAFRESMKPPDQKATEDEAYWKAYWGGMDRFGLRPLAVPGLEGEKKKDEMQRAPIGLNGSREAELAPPIVEEELGSAGVSLPAGVRRTMEARLGHDFGQVRIHTGSRAGDSAAAVGARAYAVGRDIVFGGGQFAPETSEGQRLLAHELAHVVQQETGKGRVGSGPGIEIGAADDPLERDAEQVAHAASAAGTPTPAVPRASAGSIVAADRSPRPSSAGAVGVAHATPRSSVPGAGPSQSSGGGSVLRRDGSPDGPKGKSEEGEEGDAPAAPVLGPLVMPACNPKGLSRKDFLAEPNTKQDMFGLTRFVGTVSVALSTSKVRGGVVLDELKGALPPLTSVFTGADTFIEGEIVSLGDKDSECPSGQKYPLQWRIFNNGAAAIRQGELEHCSDLQYAFDVSLGYYSGVVKDLATKKKRFATEDAAFKHLEKATGAKPADWGSIFECLAKKTELRDGKRGSTGSHTPRPRHVAPSLNDGCKFAKALVTSASLSQLGQTATPDLIQGCGESKKARDELAAKAAAAAKAAGGGEAEKGKEPAEKPAPVPKVEGSKPEEPSVSPGGAR